MDITAASNAVFSATLAGSVQLDNLSASALGRGIDKMVAGDYTAAIQEFRRTISLSPFSDNALKAVEFMANAYSADGKTEEAKKTLRNGIKVFPAADNLNVNLGNILFQEGEYKQATAEYTAAVRKNPQSSQNHYSLGQGYLAMEQYSEAEKQFKEVIRLLPNDPAGHYALGQTYRKAGRFNEAEEQLNMALSIDKEFSYAHFELGAIYAEQKDLDRAKAELAIVENKAPELYNDLNNKISENTSPRMVAAYTTNINLLQPAQTLLSTIDPSLATPGARKSFTVNFIFDKSMDPAVVQNVNNWKISRSTSYGTGGLYNWGMPIPSSEITVSSIPTGVYYDQEKFTATITFAIEQNATGNGTIDLSHLVFQFKGTDIYGNSMNPSADEYNPISLIV